MDEVPVKPAVSAWRVALPWLSVVAWAALIYFFSAQPSLSTDLGIWDLILRKSAHMVEFAMLVLLLWNAIRQTLTASGTALAIAIFISLAYAFSDELHQRFVPGRSSAFRDVGFDAAGIIIMSLVIFSRSRRASRAQTPAV